MILSPVAYGIPQLTSQMSMKHQKLYDTATEFSVISSEELLIATLSCLPLIARLDLATLPHSSDM